MAPVLPSAYDFFVYAKYLYGLTPRGKETVAAPPWVGIFPALNRLFGLEGGWSFTWTVAEVAMLCEFAGYLLTEE